MKLNISEVISEFIKNRKDVEVEAGNPEVVKAEVLEKLVEKKFGKIKSKK